MCKRFFKDVETKFNEKRYKKSIEKSNIKEFKPSNDENFNGIMHYLTSKANGNIHDHGTIEITSNSIYETDSNGSYFPRNLVDYQNDNIYLSKDDGEAFVCFDFKDKSFQISSYSIKSRNKSAYNVHLKNWAIEVSVDGKDWEEIDSHENYSELNGSGIKSRFNINNSKMKFYHFLKIRQTGNSWWSGDKHNYVGFSLFEIYGKLQEP